MDIDIRSGQNFEDIVYCCERPAGWGYVVLQVDRFKNVCRLRLQVQIDRQTLAHVCGQFTQAYPCDESRAHISALTFEGSDFANRPIFTRRIFDLFSADIRTNGGSKLSLDRSGCTGIAMDIHRASPN